MAFDWFRSYTTEWKVIPIDPETWTGSEPLMGVKTFKFKADGSDDIPKLQSGSMTVDKEIGAPGYLTGWYRCFVTMISPAGDTLAFPLATLLFESEGGELDYDTDRVSLTGQSTISPAATKHMVNGEYIRKGDNGAEWCRRQLANATPAPVVVDGDAFTVDRYYVFDEGTTVLSAVWKVLDAADWVIQIDGDGTVHLLERPKEPVVAYTDEAVSLIKPGIDYSEDIGDVPNMYIVRYNAQTYTAVNDDEESRASTITRSYVNDVYDSDPVPIGGETLEHYTHRMLENSSIVYRTYDLERDIWTDVRPYDLITIHLDGVNGDMRVISQTFTLGDGGGVSIEEEIGEEIKLWRSPLLNQQITL